MKITFYQCVQRVRTQGLALLGGLFFLSQAPAQAQQQLVWEENFNGTTINPSTWTFDQGDGCAQGVCGWGNSELETYTNRSENARVENGNLVIEARRENYQGKAFTSARLKTLGRVQFKYGTLEARIKVPNMQNGLWPAFWMLGASGTWPASGEIDIMEMGSAAAIQAGLTNRRLGGATHWENNNSHAAYDTHYDSPTDLTTDYHVYRMTWDSQAIRMFIDGHEYYAIDISRAAAADLEEFHQAQFILLNLAVGGQYTGIYDQNAISAPLPGQMLVDYIRLYQSPGDELYLGSNNSIAGDFGIYTENPAITNRLSYGQDANLYIWNNLTNIAGATPFEGQEVLALRANAGNWFGFGVDNQVKNLVAFNNGSLKFQFKTSYAGQFKFGIKSGAGESWVDFPAGVTKHGLLRDGQWHEVVIPMSAFGNGDLGSVTQTFMFAGDAASSQADFYFDNIYYSGGVAANPAPTVSVTSPTNEALITTPATLTLTANAADANGSVTKVEFYSGFTLVGTATTAPYSATWANVAPGVYTITAKATDNEGVVTTSAPVTVFVAAPNNTAPAVSLTSPAASSSFTTPATITLEANATDSDGTVYKVEFYNGTTLLGTDFTSPYTYTWSGVPAGTYSITAKVTDNGKVSTTSAPVSVTVKSNVMAGPNFGVYTDNAQMTDKLVFGQDANLYIWNNLTNIASPTPFEGPNVLALRAAAGNWFGFGIANDIKNLAAFKDGSLKFQFKTSYAGQFKFGVKTGGAEGWVDFPAGATQYGLLRDGQWHEVTIPLRAFGNLDWATLEQSLMFAGDAPTAQADFFFDHVYYNTQPVVVAPVTYCGTAASGDYSYAVTTTGTSVNFTFHPLGSVAGGNLAILYVNGPGYSMTKNAAGDFTYTLPNQTAGQALSFYFTYAVPGAGERNSAATPHSYTVGTVCGSTPAPAAPTVSLTSPTASATFTAPATITLTATATDTDGTITKVEFYQGTTLLGTSTTSPYSFTWTGAVASSYSLTAKAYDNAGLSTTSAAVAVTVTGGTTPGGDTGGYCGTAANGDYSWKAVTSGTNVTFTFHPLGATAGGNLAIVYVNGPGYGMTKNSAGDFTYTVANQTSGTTLSVYFTYQVGSGGGERNSAATPHSYTVGASCGAAPANVAPTVALTSPTATSFSAPATITLTANAADTDGSISKVEFYQGTTLLGSDATAPYSFTWSNVNAGSYSLTAKAFDDKNVTTTSAAVAITVVIPDADGDGFPADQDCDDQDATVHPGLVFYADADGDGYGNAAAPTVTACATPAGYTRQAGDCNDQDAAINPAAKDVCGQDRNCDGKLDLPAQAAPTVAVQPSSAVYTGGDTKVIYLGYGAQSVQLTSSAAAATAYSWSPATGLSATTGASVWFMPSQAGSYTFTVTARNAAGCIADATVAIMVIDARGTKNADKVLVCHQGQVLEISANAVAAHLNHGDKLGSCAATAARPGATAAAAVVTSSVITTDVRFYPNPAQDRVTLDITLAPGTHYALAIYDLKGTLVKTLSSGLVSNPRLSLEWNAREYPNGVYLVRLITDNEVINKRLVIQH